jgi:ribulose-bisphosphate carboxylase large chain
MKFDIFCNEIDSEKYIVVSYSIESKTNLREAAWNIAIGQSVGNPNVRNEWETEELFEVHSCKILGDENTLKELTQGIVKIAYPYCNNDWNTDGVSHFICQIMGGHTDIDIIQKCRTIDIQFPESINSYLLGPKFGITGFRKFVEQYEKPLFGSIVKPKIGISPNVLLEMVKQMVDGGVDFIKEDEIMSNPAVAPLERRVDIISNYLARQSKKVVFCHTINCDPHILESRVKMVANLGGNGVHINVFSGLGAYNSIRKLDLPLYLHFQSSGAKVFTDVNHRYSISWPVICKLATMMGVDTIQTGMIGGYSNDDQEEILQCVKILREGNTLPALSCGMHPGLVEKINSIVGVDYLANSGGAVHGHPSGTTAGAKAMRQAIDKVHGPEYEIAIKKWGKF